MYLGLLTGVAHVQRFNTEIEAIHKTQRQYIVTEPHVRLQLIQAAVDAIIPQYTTFYDKCVAC